MSMSDSPVHWWQNAEMESQTVARGTGSDRWDKYFLNIARNVGLLSKCASRQVGAVATRNNFFLSTGYNGAPAGVDLCQDISGECPRQVMGLQSGERLELCPASHAEANAIAIAARNGVSLHGGTMYCYCELPCVWCTGMIINAGISRVVHLTEFRDHADRYHHLSNEMFSKSHVLLSSYTEEEVAHWVRESLNVRPELNFFGERQGP